jgi:hypothetical protein
MSKCDEAVARYREKLGEHWKGADEILFRAAWNEAAMVARDQAETKRERARTLLERCTRELQALSCPLPELFEDIDAFLEEA